MKTILCNEGHIEAVASFYDKVTFYLENHINYPKWIHKQYPSLQSVTSAVSKHSQYACFDNGKVVGAFVLNNDPQGNYDVGDWSLKLEPNQYLVIHSLAVLPELTKCGIASSMIDYSINHALKIGLKAVRLDIVPTNYPAKKLYEKFGFRYVGEYDLKRGFKDIPTFCLYELNLESWKNRGNNK